MRHWFLFFFLIVVTNPYEGRGIDWGQDEPQLYEYESSYQIKTYGPEDENPALKENETAFSGREINRFINKVDSIINQTYVVDPLYRVIVE